jgi:hypothetical protein
MTQVKESFLDYKKDFYIQEYKSYIMTKKGTLPHLPGYTMRQLFKKHQQS